LVSCVAIAWLLAWLFNLDQLEAGVTTVLIIVFQIAAIVTVNVLLWD